MDMDALITEVAKRHRFVLSPDDPALAVVTLVELAGRELEARLAQVLATTDLSSKQTEVAVSGVQMACDRLAREVATELRRQMDAMNAQAREELTACLECAVTDIRQAAHDATRARRGAFAAAGITGCIGLGIVLVLTAPVWGGVFRLGG